MMVHTDQTTRCHNRISYVEPGCWRTASLTFESPYENADLPISVKIMSVIPTLTLNKTDNGRIT